MQSRTNSVSVLATLLVIGWWKSLPGPGPGFCPPRLPDVAQATESNSSTGVSQATPGMRSSLAEMAFIRYAPAASPKIPVVIANPTNGVPIWTRSARRRVDPARLQRITAQLESLLKVVQPEVSGASKGQLPRDLIPHLRRIEKLSKQLRREISQ
jgi:hypothetical protein